MEKQSEALTVSDQFCRRQNVVCCLKVYNYKPFVITKLLGVQNRLKGVRIYVGLLISANVVQTLQHFITITNVLG